MMETVSFYTLGCRLNQAETAILQRSFEREGFRIVNFRDPADIVIINTCTVTENGDADTRRLVYKINRINAQSRIALVGCQAQVQKEKLLKLPNVHWVVGNGVKMDFARLLQQTYDDNPLVIAPVIPREPFTIPVAGIDRQHTRANIKIQDGCDFFCAFCEIPYARGRARSREFNDIISEAEELVAAGHKELVLTGINIGTYQVENYSIVDVIDQLEKIDGLQRIRISSIEPTTIADSIVDQMAQKNKLCRYLHIPIQSGCDEILQAMQRRYSVTEYIAFLKAAQEKIPDVCLGTDVITGYPGETEDHFDETYTLLREYPFTYFHVFSYSDRNRARSRKIKEKIPVKIIERRSKRLRELSARKRRTYLERFIGKTEWVLFEQVKKGFWTGLTDTYIRVNIQSELDLKNRILPVKLERIDQQTMVGSLV